MGIKKLENGEQFIVGEKTYKVNDDELFEIIERKVITEENPYRILPYTPESLGSPQNPWYGCNQMLIKD